MSEGIQLSYEVLDNDFASCGKASEEVKRTLRSAGFPADYIRRIAIAMYEGEINMVIHANGGRAEVDIQSDSVTVDLIDAGKGIEDIEKAMQEGYSTATDDIRELGFGAGMGLPNMKKYSDEMQINSKVNQGTHIRLKFFLNPPNKTN